MQVETSRPGNMDSARLKAAFARLFARMQSLGFDAVIYHYTPVPRSPDGELMTPSLREMRNAPADMHQLWCERGYYQANPVQRYALQSCVPFAWSYQFPASCVLRHMMDNNAREVSRYMCDNNMPCGATVPLHLPNGGFVTLTGILTRHYTEPDISDTLARMMFLAHHFQETAFPLFDASMRTCHHIRLSNRERECLAWSAEGLTAKQIARKLHRSVATITLHLNTAAKKLGATNRVQAVVRAMHYRLLDS
ncbi:AhyR/AsaR family transcriptional regulator [Trabulsiella guamensis ATCC 49490]|uniref:AhyR/AsaR family transcriptional regulator n=1 Tax=Trabulsiella guamensis ATCC 49490 TaxID=1005994 RepID=A0A085AGE0_9ENTR|nr:LuxR family transcriptional regulator [Trabulsiella guamensis]KFC09285.1 AhyR/AsaR family transcriptional regulator [Trabulsiella guamensis ATCC 49490]